MSMQQLLGSRSAINMVELSDFDAQFNTDKSGTLTPQSQKALGQYANQLSKQLGGCEIYIGVSRGDDGKLRAVVNSGGRDDVTGTFLTRTPIFQGHLPP